MEARTKGRLTLVALALLFIGPLAIAWALYMGDFWRPGAGVNHGQLLEPVQTLPRDPQPMPGDGVTEGGYLMGKWTVVHFADGQCPQECKDALVKTRQVRLALGRYLDRIQRVLYVNGAAPEQQATAIHPDLLTVLLAGETGDTISALLRAKGGGENFYLVDPLGNLILAYPLDTPHADLRDDMKKLLRVSRIG